ncbi:uncharacterized protein PADG_01282 [Paracoccidioides brasiliensis Pb18]|uniref:Uncharacterized protein n=1 Tax=Paracoccidioides brasiliensis (strain Pb18) TaxID=502780 RepID=C1G2W6_PARBD|nr:uncharacterized protein PADG_01282 [Paracoccidioides brasiliensis Pb18]EEH45132.1 hypothetical protein PADG_01282 [Paracoccidioides brasiliensis Pb18]
MPPLPGEECLVTVFVDVHYYFSAPSPRPAHHRFDKGSYLYVYHDAVQHKAARIEIANYPGMPEQDAFCGSLGDAHLHNSDKFPTLYTLTVDDPRQSIYGSPPPSSADRNEWLLAHVDPRDGSRAVLRLHTLDLYFWTSNDAALFSEAVRKARSPPPLNTFPVSEAPGQDPAVSPVVRQLENVAITDPAYHNGQTRNSRSESPQLQQPAPQQGVPGFAPRPIQLAVSSEPVSPLATPAPPASKPEELQVNYAPLAYNPAAPAAPEPIKLREETPPPLDAASGTGLAAAVISDHGQSFPPARPPMSPGFPPHPPGQIPGYGGQYGSQPPTAGLTHTPSTSSHASRHNPTASMSYVSPPVATHAPPPPVTPGAVPYSQPQQPAADPNAHLWRQQNFGGPHPASPHHSQTQHYQAGYAGQAPPPPQPPIGRYSHYSYGQSQQQQQQLPPGGTVYDIHHQVYRPTESEAAAPYAKQPQRQSGIGRGVGKLLKKLEKF